MKAGRYYSIEWHGQRKAARHATAGRQVAARAHQRSNIEWQWAAALGQDGAHAARRNWAAQQNRRLTSRMSCCSRSVRTT